jgi:cell division protein FtsN
LQAGNFREPGDAERARAAVLLLGLEAFIVTRQDASGATGHRVRVGPFFDQNRLVEAKQRLRGANIRYDIIRVTG